MTEAFGFDRGGVRRIGNSVRATEARGRKVRDGQHRYPKAARGSSGGGGEVLEEVKDRLRGYMLETLNPSTNCGANPTTAQVAVWDASSGTWAATGTELTITNRDDNLVVVEGSYVHFKLYPGGEYAIDYYNHADCGPQPAVCGPCHDQGGSGENTSGPCSWEISGGVNYGGLFSGDTLELCYASISNSALLGDRPCLWASESSAAVAIDYPGHGAADAFLRWELTWTSPGDMVLALRGYWREDPQSDLTEHPFLLKSYGGWVPDGDFQPPWDEGDQFLLPALWPSKSAPGSDFDFGAGIGDPCPSNGIPPQPTPRVPAEVVAIGGTAICSGTWTGRWDAASSRWLTDSESCNPSDTSCCPRTPYPWRDGSVDGEIIGPYPCVGSAAAMPLKVTTKVLCQTGGNCNCDVNTNRPSYPSAAMAAMAAARSIRRQAEAAGLTIGEFQDYGPAPSGGGCEGCGS